MQNKIGTKNYSCAYNQMLHRLSTVKYLNKYLNIVIFTRIFELKIIHLFVTGFRNLLCSTYFNKK